MMEMKNEVEVSWATMGSLAGSALLKDMPNI
jgi:hypothetical protein